MPRATLIVLLMLAPFWKRGDAQGPGDEAHARPDAPGGGGAFFALRSCHRLLSGDRGEFFSPDYLCSNPPLWCNWTIQARPGKRIRLDLEDFTPDDACHLKRDQIHVDEPAGPSGGHRVLQRCWREAKYTSSSNVLSVVLLIGGWHSPQYRGFYGRYQAFGPPVVYNPQDGSTSAGPVDLGEDGPVLEVGRVESGLSEPADSDPVRGSNEAEAEVSEDQGPVPSPPAVPASTQKTPRSGRGVSHSPQNHEPDPRRPTPSLTDEAPGVETNTLSWGGENSLTGTEVREAADQSPPPTPAEPEPEGSEQAHAQPNMVELLSDHRGSPSVRNQSVTPHLPGDFLFEVSVEVDFSPDPEASWDSQARALLLPLKSWIREKLDVQHASLSSKRVKRLNAGVLYILWLQVTRGGPGAPRALGSVRSALQGLVSSGLGVGRAVVVSVSTADVNECGTQLLLCDVNADCVNHFGSYSCACRPGFRDESRLGSGGSVCVDVRGCSSGLSPEAKGVYVLFFLLSSLMLVLLVAAGVVYRRHHRGAFMVHCHSSRASAPDLNNNHHRRHDDEYSYPAEADLPPPLPPARGPRGAWPQGKERGPAGDLPLLRFSSLLPPDDCVETQEAGRM